MNLNATELRLKNERDKERITTRKLVLQDCQEWLQKAQNQGL
ncbi:hypothetical protein [Helicobacter sp. 23-1045]